GGLGGGGGPDQRPPQPPDRGRPAPAAARPAGVHLVAGDAAVRPAGVRRADLGHRPPDRRLGRLRRPGGRPAPPARDRRGAGAGRDRLRLGAADSLAGAAGRPPRRGWGWWAVPPPGWAGSWTGPTRGATS